jgi:hypothetical protein
MRLMVLSDSSSVDRMRCVTLMLFLILGFSLGKDIFFFLFPFALLLLLVPKAVLREVATKVHSPSMSGSDSSEVVGPMASNLATAFMNFARSEGRVMNNPVGDSDVRTFEIDMRSFLAWMIGAAPAGSSSSSITTVLVSIILSTISCSSSSTSSILSFTSEGRSPALEYKAELPALPALATKEHDEAEAEAEAEVP